MKTVLLGKRQTINQYPLSLYSSSSQTTATNNCDSKSSNPCESESCAQISPTNSFILKIEEPITMEEIENENIAKIVRLGENN